MINSALKKIYIDDNECDITKNWNVTLYATGKIQML